MPNNKKAALFICLGEFGVIPENSERVVWSRNYFVGNICRSPIAEAVFIDEVKKAGEAADWDIDSAGIGGWHAGNAPDRRAAQTMKNHNLEYNNRARQVHP